MDERSRVDRMRDFGAAVDFGRTADDYQRFRAGFPERFFASIADRSWIAPGQRALDLGTGTGTVARGLARRGLSVTGLDPAPHMVERARELDTRIGVEVEYRVGRAEDVDVPDGTLDLVTAGQCWHWFDGPRTAAEVARVLRPGGRVIVAHFDWLPLPGNVVEAAESLMLAHNPKWALAGSTGLYPDWFEHLAGAGFESLESFSFDIDQPYSHEAWRGRIRASSGVSASLSREGSERFDREHARLLHERFPEDPLSVPHRVWAVSGTRR
ncbi:MAG: class I SAM-dependent methyltransferase [Planctomycetota bacterium]|jgi:SAM-dependent methyltransferase